MNINSQHCDSDKILEKLQLEMQPMDSLSSTLHKTDLLATSSITSTSAIEQTIKASLQSMHSSTETVKESVQNSHNNKFEDNLNESEMFEGMDADMMKQLEQLMESGTPLHTFFCHCND